MGSLRGAIRDDVEEYESLCRLYGEKPVVEEYGYGPDPYCKHASRLIKRHRNNIRRRRKKKL